MSWYKFESLDSFDSWHNALKESLGYPLPSLDRDGNLIGEPFTTEYTQAVIVADNDVRAFVEDHLANGLTLSEHPRSNDERELT